VQIHPSSFSLKKAVKAHHPENQSLHHKFSEDWLSPGLQFFEENWH
jgi:hypothetical protein